MHAAVAELGWEGHTAARQVRSKAAKTVVHKLQLHTTVDILALALVSVKGRKVIATPVENRNAALQI